MMYAKCDGCGKEVPASHNGRDWFKPRSWYERTVGEPGQPSEVLQACSRECIERVHAARIESGKPSHNVVLPI